MSAGLPGSLQPSSCTRSSAELSFLRALPQGNKVAWDGGQVVGRGVEQILKSHRWRSRQSILQRSARGAREGDPQRLLSRRAPRRHVTLSRTRPRSRASAFYDYADAIDKVLGIDLGPVGCFPERCHHGLARGRRKTAEIRQGQGR